MSMISHSSNTATFHIVTHEKDMLHIYTYISILHTHIIHPAYIMWTDTHINVTQNTKGPCRECGLATEHGRSNCKAYIKSIIYEKSCVLHFHVVLYLNTTLVWLTAKDGFRIM